MSDLKQKDLTKIVELDLGKRIIEIHGNYFTGKVKVAEVIAEELQKKLAEPELYMVDLGERKVCINGQNYTGIVKSEKKSFISELRYRASLAQQNDARLSKANVNPNQFRDSHAGRPVIEINGASYVKVGG